LSRERSAEIDDGNHPGLGSRLLSKNKSVIPLRSQIDYVKA